MYTDSLPDDGRLEELHIVASELGEKLVPLLPKFEDFSTKQDRYKKPISCVVAIWRLDRL